MSQVFAVLGALVYSVIVLVCISFLLSFPMMLLWNECLVGAVLVVAKVTWLQMWGVAILTGLLLGMKVS